MVALELPVTLLGLVSIQRGDSHKFWWCGVALRGDRILPGIIALQLDMYHTRLLQIGMGVHTMTASAGLPTKVTRAVGA